MIKYLFFRILLAAVFVLLLVSLILYARGYRLNVSEKTITPTGILVASSYPDGAKIFLNGELKAATNSNLTLAPGIYSVKMSKDGYLPWEKTVTIKGEIVVKADALLPPQNPSLSPITSLGVTRALFLKKTSKIMILSRVGNEEKDGVYLLDGAKKTLTLFNPLKLLTPISAFSQEIDFSQSTIVFSPKNTEVIFTTGTPSSRSYLISTENESHDLFDVTTSKETLEGAWKEEEARSVQKILEAFDGPFDQVASDSFHIIDFSPDDTKVLYEATKQAILPPVIIPPLIGANQTKEERTISKSGLYVYDRKEDKNFLIPHKLSLIGDSVLWYPDSTHLVMNEGKHIAIVDYDGENKRTVYSGPYEEDFLAVTEEGKVLVLANLNPQTNKLPDVYAIGIK